MGAAEKIRVMIVDDIAETRENIRKLLQFESDFEVVAVARTGREGIQLAKETRPDVILMDINMPDMDGIAATETIRKDNPYSKIVILSVQGDPNYMRRAMLAGARDFLTKPPTIDELTSAIRRQGKLAREERAMAAPAFPTQPVGGRPAIAVQPFSLGRVISVYSPKGGTGCTTVAVNLAVALHNDESPVAVVDGDLQFGDVAVFLNEQAKNSIVDLAPRSEELDPEIIGEVMLNHADSGIKVLASPFHPEQAENVNGNQFSKVLDYLRRMFAYIIVDTDSALTDITLAAIDTSDLIILLTTQDIPAIKNARLFLDLAEILKIDRKRILFVMNRFDKRIGITPEKVGESFKHEVSAVVPFDDRVVVPSINRGRPFMLGDKGRPIARGILSLTEAIRQRLETLEPVTETIEPVRSSKK
jgi:pilus assembly protein CpaE